jgi:membrane-associated phospholipid phosphatase
MRRQQLLFAVSGAAVAAFAALARSVARRDTDAQDHRFRRSVVASQGQVDRAVAKAVGPLGKEWLHAPIALVFALALWQRGAGRRAALPLVASISAELVNRLCERTLHIRQPPPGKKENRHKPSFPSGHAIETAAVALTSTYVLAREGVVSAAPSAVVAVALAAASGGGRVYLDRHWASDSVGGYLLGIAIAAACGALYETAADKRSVRAGAFGSNLQPQPA